MGLQVPPRTAAEPTTSPLPAVSDVLTPRAIACGIILGLAVSLANMYFGLQAGTVNAMPMQSALLGSAILGAIQHRFPTSQPPVAPAEIALVEVIAGALGLAPFTSGFTSFLPALEFLTGDEDGPPVRFSLPQLLLWSLAICGLGIVAAAPFRRLFIHREPLRFPSATATGTLISILFGRPPAVTRAEPDDSSSSTRPVYRSVVTDPSGPTEHESPTHQLEQYSNTQPIKVLLLSLAFSALFSLVAHFVPALKHLPIFGHTLARDWLWEFDLSPAYFGYGIIIGPSINASTFLGAVLGWGILSPIAKHNGWTSGPVGDWENGSRGWILWVGMGLILGDSLVGIAWIVLKLCSSRASYVLQTIWAPWLRRSNGSPSEQTPLLPDSSDSNHPGGAATSAEDTDDWPDSSITTPTLVLWLAVALYVTYFACLGTAFREFIPSLATLLAAVLVPLAGFVSMRSLGETDNGAALAVGTIAQLIASLVVPSSSAQYMPANLLFGGVVEAGASQAAQHMGGLKTAYITQTPPRAVFWGQMVGSFAGALIATFLYRAYTTVKELPSGEFGIPDGYLYLVAARFLRQQGLPPGAIHFSIGALVLGAVLSAFRIMGSEPWWRPFVPSGIAMAIGMYIVPSITLPRALGSLIMIVGRRHLGFKDMSLLCCATGFILGQGIVSPLALLWDTLHIPTSDPSKV
ncbi:OPT oligopeptide transporter protein-domain-containing protein [Ilyonectria robusta]|uniref:OPT oligopeptide transporter protein-domain-containing protein n=1 Tax=Ilyonectria robusta TaxID=1079257 RepID=UPI001E8DF9E5|nr:OPT oligopeptide transporter protein-domain-containing protein [Ilyonectria robusta]KAH8729235.1 OPT oligopeptide transporter protein-domain-containing protein [Ilyonectria robusta]